MRLSSTYFLNEILFGKMTEENGHKYVIPNALPRYKLVIVGDGACGKTSILTRFSVRSDLKKKKKTKVL